MSRRSVGDIEGELTGDTVTRVSPAPDPAGQRSSALRHRRATGLRRLVGGVVIVGALLAVGCGDDGSGTAADNDPAATGGRSGGDAPLQAEAAAAIDLKVVADGSQVALADVAATDRPTLLWFWAPF